MKQPRCKICRSPYIKYRSTQTICNDIKCAIEAGRRKTEKDKRAEAKKERREFLEKKEKLKSRSDYIKEAQVESQVGSKVWSQLKDCVYNYRGGQLWLAGWCAYVSFFRDQMEWNDPILERFEIDEALCKSCGWVWWHENVLAISDRPSEIHRDQQGRLHAEKGPSIAYRDGWGLHHWHGVAIPGEWVTGKPPGASEALTWSNIEQRRAACEIVGWNNVLKQLKAKVIDEDSNVQIGTLLEANIPDSGKERFLKVKCGTGREFCIPVPREMKTALQANSWTYGLSPSEFQPEVRT